MGYSCMPRLRRITFMTTGILAIGVAITACGGGSAAPGVAAGSTAAPTGPAVYQGRPVGLDR